MNYEEKRIHNFNYSCEISCSTDSFPEDENPSTLPEHTPMIMGLLEATNDTIHHYPELVVGFVNNVEGYINPNRMRDLPGLYNPTLYSQVTKATRLFHLSFTPDDDAVIKVTGPLNSSANKEVIYEYLNNGLFGDTNYELNIRPGGEYLLDVTFSDGRTYQATTRIPEETTIEVPDSLGLTVDYAPYNDGSAREATRPDSYYYIQIPFPEETYLTEIQSNTNHDREILLMNDDEDFLYSDRSPYLRTGTLYGINMTGEPLDSLRRQWEQDLYDKKKEDVRHSRYVWMRFSFFNEGVGEIFHPIDEAFFTTNGKTYEELMLERFTEEFEARNSSYLLDVSTIKKVDEDGNVLPQDETDAIGFFAGYFSVYRTTTLYPLRTFDLDSVLSNNRVYNPDGNE